MNNLQLRRILYIEDDSDIREVVKLSLEAVGGFQTQVCASGEEALLVLPAFRPDLILLDVMMPGMDGPATLRRLRELPEGEGIPAIFMTAKMQPGEVVQFERMEALGLIPKPFDPMTLAQTVHDLWTSKGGAAAGDDSGPTPKVGVPLEMELAKIRDQYLRSLPDKIHEISTLCEALRARNHAADTTRALHRAVHTLHGSAETFGLPGVTRVARDFEQHLTALIDQPAALEAADPTRVFALLRELEQSAQACVISPKDLALAPATSENPKAAPQAVPSAVEAPTVYLLEEQAEVGESLAAQLEGFGYAVQRFSVPEALLHACRYQPPAAVIADIAVPHGDEAVSRLRVSGLHAPPVVFLSARDDVPARLQAARAGGQAYFTKPVRIASLVDKLDELCHAAAPELYRVLVIDDSSEQAAFHSTILRHAGMLTETVKDPLRILEAVRTFSPDLVLMDMYLPGCSGDELARVIRQIEPQVGVPIVFLSIERDLDKQVAALFGAGDEFLTKPIQPRHLVSVVTSHVEHYRKLRSLMVLDGLTGLANHSHLQRALEREMARAVRHGTSLALAMIDIDHFKQVNDSHGHPAGDRVLRGLSRFLRQRLRSSDLIARYGGEEFAALLPGADGEAAYGVIDRLRGDFAALRHQNDLDESFSVTFSAGLAALPAHRTARDLLLAADRALYLAKERGRNRVMLGS